MVDGAIDLASAGLAGSSTTWTYLVNDNPFSTFGMSMLASRNIGVAGAMGMLAVLYWPVTAMVDSVGVHQTLAGQAHGPAADLRVQPLVGRRAGPAALAPRAATIGEMLLRRALLMAALAALLTAAVHGAAAQIVRDQRRLESGVDLVMVTATVFDAQGPPRDRPAARRLRDLGGRPRSRHRGLQQRRACRSASASCSTSATACSGSASSTRATAVEHFLFTLLDPADEFFLTAFNHCAAHADARGPARRRS